MRWRWAMGLAAVAQVALAAPSREQLAEQYYQRGMKSQALSEAAFRGWARTLSVPARDLSTDAWLFAVDQYSNAVHYNPAHWRAHRRLGQLFAQARGTHPNDTLAVMNLVAYLALAPNDPGTPDAKITVDQRLATLVSQNEIRKLAGELSLDPVKARQMFAQEARDDYLAAAREESDLFKQQSDLAAFSSALPDMFAEQVHFNAELAKRISERSKAAAGGMGGEGAMPGGEAGVPMAGGPGAEAAGEGTAEQEATATEEEVFRNVALMVAYVPDYLAMIGGMHRFMAYCDQHRVAYDPRAPEMLIGEAVIQLRRLFTRGAVGQLAAVKNEYAKMAKVGSLSPQDFWSYRDYSEPMPDFLIAAGSLERPDLEEKFYGKSISTSVVRLPAYSKDADDLDLANAIDRANLSAAESLLEWMRWRDALLAGTAGAYALSTADEVFLRDWMRVGSGQVTGWVGGPLPPVRTASAPVTERSWLVAAR